ncbi:hypothetical protein [Photobacterium sp. DNB22_13_2]
MQVMELPKFFYLVKNVSIVGAVLGCLAGSLVVLGGLDAFNWGFMAGMSAIAGGVATIISSLVGLGLVFCFLAIVEAQIDTRNIVARSLEQRD